MPFTGRTSAIIVPFMLPAGLEAIRQRHVANAQLGVPAHVTLLVPFVPPACIDRDVVDRAAAAVHRTPALDVAFTSVKHWDPSPDTPEGVVWLPPEPAAPFLELIAAILDGFPGYPPYGGLHDEVIPHVTLANTDMDIAAIEADASRRLPFSRRATTALLLVEDETGRWRAARRFRLG